MIFAPARVVVRFHELADRTAHLMMIQHFEFLCEFDIQCVDEKLRHRVVVVKAVSTETYRAFGTMVLEPTTTVL